MAAYMGDKTLSALTLFLLNKNIEKQELNNCSDSSDTTDISDSEDELEDIFVNFDLKLIYLILMVGETRGETVITEKIEDYVARVIPGYSRTVFKEHFRIFPETFEMVLRIIGPALHAINKSPGRKPIPEQKQLLIAIWFMATPDSYRSVATKFGVGRATAFRALRRVTYALHCIAPRFITWPKGQVAVNVMQEFERSCDFPNVIGAIGGTHIKIQAPSKDANSYINRKGFHSIKVQVICNSLGHFTHVYAGQVGSVHDSRVFRNSPVARFIELPEEYFPNNSHIIGDAAYAIHPHVMVPFRNNGHLTNRQINFNYCLSSTRMAVQRAIGSLKMRFRILLDCLPLKDTKKIAEFILACCVLHNICLLQNDEMPVGIQLGYDEEVGLVHGNAVELGKEKRITIMNALRMRRGN